MILNLNSEKSIRTGQTITSRENNEFQQMINQLNDSNNMYKLRNSIKAYKNEFKFKLKQKGRTTISSKQK